MNPESIWNAARSGKLFTIKNVKITGMETYERPIGTPHLIKLTFRNSKTGNESVLQDVNLEDIEVCEKPKHDPCRMFRKGDVVEPKQVKGRVYSKDSKHLIGKKCIVFRDEEEPGYVVISYAGKNYSINAAYLELITPVEELEPYTIELGVTGKGTDYRIKKDGVIICAYSCAHPNPRRAAGNRACSTQHDPVQQH